MYLVSGFEFRALYFQSTIKYKFHPDNGHPNTKNSTCCHLFRPYLSVDTNATQYLKTKKSNGVPAGPQNGFCFSCGSP
jgi:hypothetical protein